MHRIAFFLLMMLCHIDGNCRYPFEKYKPVYHTNKIRIKVYGTPSESATNIKSDIVFGEFYWKDKKVKLVFNDTGSHIDIYNDKKLAQRFPSGYICDINIDDYALIADYNGDKISDMKMVLWQMGNGLAAYNIEVIYLFGTKSGGFVKVSYSDKHGEHLRERDFDGDGICEILVREHVHYGGHSYWSYNLYNYINSKMVNVNDKANYPILIQHLYRNNYEITKHLTRHQLKQFARPQPLNLTIAR